MNKEEKIVKDLSKFGQTITKLEFGGEVYFLAESGKMIACEEFGCQKEFNLFSSAGIQLGKLYLQQLKMNEKMQGYAMRDGALSYPEYQFSISQIEVAEKARGKHLGDFLFNLAMKDIESVNSQASTTIPLLFVRENSWVTIPFFEKWGAKINTRTPRTSDGTYCAMIIENPQSKREYDGKILEQYNFPVEKKRECI